MVSSYLYSNWDFPFNKIFYLNKFKKNTAKGGGEKGVFQSQILDHLKQKKSITHPKKIVSIVYHIISTQSCKFYFVSNTAPKIPKKYNK